MKYQRFRNRVGRMKGRKRGIKKHLTKVKMILSQLKLMPGPCHNGQLRRLRNQRRRMDLKSFLTEIPRSYRLTQKGGGEVVVVEDASPNHAAKSFWRNSLYFGIRRYRQELPKGLFFLTLLITVNGVNVRVARQINYLFSYISQLKPHGFIKQLKICTRLCQLLS
jgi:hypothetical protein